MDNNKQTPIVYLEIDFEDMESGVSAISFVDKPATEIGWMTFNEIQKFEKKDVQRIITGPIMLAETEILRFSESLGEYFVKFSKKTVFDMMKKYFKENKIHIVNEEHDPTRIPKGVYMIESYIINDNIKSELYPNITNGSWVASFYIEDENYWNELKSNGFTGFSLEGMFTDHYEEETINKIFNSVKNIIFSNLPDIDKEEQIKILLNI